MVTSTDGSFQTVIPPGFADARGRESLINAQYLAVGVPHMAIDVVGARAPANVNLDVFARGGLEGLRRMNPLNHDFTAIHRFTVAGSPARSISYLTHTPAGRAAIETQLYVLHEGWVYGIDGSAPPDGFKTIRAAVVQVLANWRWR